MGRRHRIRKCILKERTNGGKSVTQPRGGGLAGKTAVTPVLSARDQREDAERRSPLAARRTRRAPNKKVFRRAAPNPVLERSTRELGTTERLQLETTEGRIQRREHRRALLLDIAERMAATVSLNAAGIGPMSSRHKPAPGSPARVIRIRRE
jgi:hypothetical protein